MSKYGHVEHYHPPDENFLNEQICCFDIVYTQYCNTIVDYLVDTHYDHQDIVDIIVRLDQREYYNAVFHEMPKGMNELKKTALFCYWLLKYRPLFFSFRAKTPQEKKDTKARENYDNARTYFTERFCLYLLEGEHWHFLNKDLPLSPRHRAELEYDFRHADISKEAMIRIVELLINVY